MLKVIDVQYVSINDMFIYNYTTALKEYQNLSINVTHFLIHCYSPSIHLEIWNATLSRLAAEQLSNLNEKVFIEYPHLREKMKRS